MINENMEQKAQGKTDIDNINQDKEQTQSTELVSPKAGTATSSPVFRTASPSDMNIANTMLWMKKNAYQDTTIKKVAKLLRHLQRNCNIRDAETVKLYIAKKGCSNGHKENLVEAYAIPVVAETDEEIKKAIQDDCILVCQANGKTNFKKPV